MFRRRRTPDPAEWVLLASGRVDDPDTGWSALAVKVRTVLQRGGVTARLQPYVLPDRTVVIASWIRDGGIAGPQAIDRIRIGVLVPGAQRDAAVRAVLDARDGSDVFDPDEAHELSRQLRA